MRVTILTALLAAVLAPPVRSLEWHAEDPGLDPCANVTCSKLPSEGHAFARMRLMEALGASSSTLYKLILKLEPGAASCAAAAVVENLQEVGHLFESQLAREAKLEVERDELALHLARAESALMQAGQVVLRPDDLNSLAAENELLKQRLSEGQDAILEVNARLASADRVINALRISQPAVADSTGDQEAAPRERATPPAQSSGESTKGHFINLSHAEQRPLAIAAEAQERLLARAQRLVRAKDIVAARLVLQRAVDGRHGRAAYLLAQTYDPAFLKSIGVPSTYGNPNKAQELYARATQVGTAMQLSRH